MPPEHRQGARHPGEALRLPWQLIGFAAPLALAALLGMAWIADQLADTALERAASTHLIAVRAAAEAAASAEIERNRDAVRRLAVDARVGAALSALAEATRASDDDPRAASEALAPQRSAVLAHLEQLYAPLRPARPGLDIAALLPSARRTIWLQAQYLPGTVPAADGAYAEAHARWHPLLAEQAARAGFADLLLVRASDGVVVYDVAKTPLFQTSLVDGPYADSHLAGLFRRLRAAPEAGAVRLVDFAAFLPAAGAPQAFAAAAVSLDGAPTGVLIAALDGAGLTRALSGGGRWSALGLGARGDVFLLGADGRLRSDPRLRSAAPDGGAASTTAIATVAAPPALANARPEADSVTAYAVTGGPPMLASVGPSGFGELGWRAVATLDANEARRGAAGLATQLAVVALAIGVALMAALGAVAWWLAVPLGHLTTSLARLRPNDAKAQAPVLGGGDAAALATQVNRLLAASRDQAAAARRVREAEARALAAVINAWGDGDRATRAYAGGELAVVAAAVNGMADRVAAAAPAPAAAVVSDALQAAAAHLRSEAARHLDAVDAAAAAAQQVRDRAARMLGLAQDALDGSRSAADASLASHSAVLRLDAALDAARLPDVTASLATLDSGAGSAALLADELAVLAVNAALLAERGDGDDGALAVDARAAAEHASGIGAQLDAVRERVRALPAIDGCAGAVGDARREAERAARALARCAAGIGELASAARSDEDGDCAAALQAAHAAARRLCQAAEVLAREARVGTDTPAISPAGA
ncbi:MAG: hypothetical protein ABI629_07335 [bacterium]